MMQSSSAQTSPGQRIEAAETDHRALMDRIYRGQRHIYDLTRRYFLLGRDTLIERMEVQEGDRVLEIGCGTARNLVYLARRHPSILFFGIDASAEMLKSAEGNLSRAGLGHSILLALCLAEDFSPASTFGHDRPFDTVFFSYSLSMIPQWQEAVDRALSHLKTGGNLWVVDFWDQQGLPAWFAAVLKRWLRLFHVQHRPELLAYFRELEKTGSIRLSVEPLYRRYAYLARLTKTGQVPDIDRIA